MVPVLAPPHYPQEQVHLKMRAPRKAGAPFGQ
jgi:hypothetical protein